MEKVGAGVPFVIRISLKENSARGIFRSVSGNGKRFHEVWEIENRA